MQQPRWHAAPSFVARTGSRRIRDRPPSGPWYRADRAGETLSARRAAAAGRGSAARWWASADAARADSAPSRDFATRVDRMVFAPGGHRSHRKPGPSGTSLGQVGRGSAARSPAWRPDHASLRRSRPGGPKRLRRRGRRGRRVPLGVAPVGNAPTAGALAQALGVHSTGQRSPTPSATMSCRIPRPAAHLNGRRGRQPRAIGPGLSDDAWRARVERPLAFTALPPAAAFP